MYSLARTRLNCSKRSSSNNNPLNTKRFRLGPGHLYHPFLYLESHQSASFVPLKNVDQSCTFRHSYSYLLATIKDLRYKVARMLTLCILHLAYNLVLYQSGTFLRGKLVSCHIETKCIFLRSLQSKIHIGNFWLYTCRLSSVSPFFPSPTFGVILLVYYALVC